jgi:hypothetical protein
VLRRDSGGDLKQTKWQSFAEACMYAFLGSLGAMFIFYYGSRAVTALEPSLLDTLKIQGLFFVWAAVKYFAVRRGFIWWWRRGKKKRGT